MFKVQKPQLFSSISLRSPSNLPNDLPQQLKRNKTLADRVKINKTNKTRIQSSLPFDLSRPIAKIFSFLTTDQISLEGLRETNKSTQKQRNRVVSFENCLKTYQKCSRRCLEPMFENVFQPWYS
jgi:hypothetical protein